MKKNFFWKKSVGKVGKMGRSGCEKVEDDFWEEVDRKKWKKIGSG